MDQVLGNEHTTNPSIIIALISDTSILEAAGSPRHTTPSPNEFLLDDSELLADSLLNHFSTGRKVKPKKNDKVTETIVDLMMQGLEIKEAEIEQRKTEQQACEAILARAEEQKQKLVDFMEILVKHFVRE